MRSRRPHTERRIAVGSRSAQGVGDLLAGVARSTIEARAGEHLQIMTNAEANMWVGQPGSATTTLLMRVGDSGVRAEPARQDLMCGPQAQVKVEDALRRLWLVAERAAGRCECLAGAPPALGYTCAGSWLTAAVWEIAGTQASVRSSGTCWESSPATASEVAAERTTEIESDVGMRDSSMTRSGQLQDEECRSERMRQVACGGKAAEQRCRIESADSRREFSQPGPVTGFAVSVAEALGTANTLWDIVGLLHRHRSAIAWSSLSLSL